MKTEPDNPIPAMVAVPGGDQHRVILAGIQAVRPRCAAGAAPGPRLRMTHAHTPPRNSRKTDTTTHDGLDRPRPFRDDTGAVHRPGPHGRRPHRRPAGMHRSGVRVTQIVGLSTWNKRRWRTRCTWIRLRCRAGSISPGLGWVLGTMSSGRGRRHKSLQLSVGWRVLSTTKLTETHRSMTGCDLGYRGSPICRSPMSSWRVCIGGRATSRLLGRCQLVSSEPVEPTTSAGGGDGPAKHGARCCAGPSATAIARPWR